MNAVLGFAGLPVTLSALEAGKRLALANKESLIAAAPLVARGARDAGRDAAARRLRALRDPPVPRRARRGRRATPTCADCCSPPRADPFAAGRTSSSRRSTKSDALQHPTWSMGPKITDRLLDAHEQGSRSPRGVGALRHRRRPGRRRRAPPVDRALDGRVRRRFGARPTVRPDMRLPIAYCLGCPSASTTAGARLDFTQTLELTFEAPDREAFPALDLAYEAARSGGAAPAWLRAANEVRRRGVPRRPDHLARDRRRRRATSWTATTTIRSASLDDLFANDARARREAHSILEQ